MRRRVALLDCDGILAAFVPAYLEVVYRVTGRKHSPHHVTDFDIDTALSLNRSESAMVKRTISATRSWCEYLDVYPGAKEGVAELERICDVYIVTSPWTSSPTWTHERETWLKRHFDIGHDRVVHTHAKHLCRGDILIDDKVSTVAQWQAKHTDGLGVVWSQHWNERTPWSGLRTDSWDALLAIAEGAEL